MELLNSLRYSLHVIFHPFDGFWDLKHEKRGNYKTAFVFLLLLVITIITRKQLTGFIVEPSNVSYLDIISQFLLVIIPFFLWCISNWSITTLVDGEGKFGDIVITSAYALVPFILLSIPNLIISNIITIKEIDLYNTLNYIGIGWSALLLFIGIMTIHRFTVKKTIITIFIAVVAMLIIITLFVVFISIIQNLFNFIVMLFQEFSLRQ